MSPELNGNPPILPRRKKNRERKHASTSNIRQEFSVPAYYHCQPNLTSTYCPFPATGYPMHPEPMSLPIFPSSYPHYSSPPIYNGHNGSMNGMMPGKPYKNKTKVCNQNEECMSLPVVKDELDDDDPGQRRYSDPGIPNDSDSGSDNGDKQMFLMLTQQVNVLLDSNRQLMREVTELRFELNMLKQQQMHSSCFERDYEPGMIADFIKEIREAARMREDALIAKVKHMVEEKQFSANQFQLATEKTRHNERLAKLEEQMKSLNVTTNNSLRYEDSISLPSTSMTASDEATSQANRQVCELEREVLQLRREVQDSRSKKEDSDSKIHQLERRLSILLHCQQQQQPATAHFNNNNNNGNIDDKLSLLSSSSSTTAAESLATTSTLAATSSPHKFMQVGPVTDL